VVYILGKSLGVDVAFSNLNVVFICVLDIGALDMDNDASLRQWFILVFKNDEESLINSFVSLSLDG
jgi:hypothetical protein